VEVDPVEGIQREEVEVVSHPLAGGFEDPFDNEGSSNKGWTHVKGVSLFSRLVGTAPDHRSLLKNGDLESAGLEANGFG
jgi:hypothetical protein